MKQVVGQVSVSMTEVEIVMSYLQSQLRIRLGFFIPEPWWYAIDIWWWWWYAIWQHLTKLGWKPQDQFSYHVLCLYNMKTFKSSLKLSRLFLKTFSMDKMSQKCKCMWIEQECYPSNCNKTHWLAMLTILTLYFSQERQALKVLAFALRALGWTEFFV